MSYSLLVRGDNPLDYWKLNSNPTTTTIGGYTSPTSWPTQSSVGIPAGTTLTLGSSSTITVPNTFISGLDIVGNVDVQASGVVIQNSRIRSASVAIQSITFNSSASTLSITTSTPHGVTAGNNFGILGAASANNNAYTASVVSSSTITVGKWVSGSTQGAVGSLFSNFNGVIVRPEGSLIIKDCEFDYQVDYALYGDNWTASGILFQNSFSDSVKMLENTSLTNSWLGNYLYAPNGHTDGIQVSPLVYRLTLTGNTVIVPASANSAILFNPDSNARHKWTENQTYPKNAIIYVGSSSAYFQALKTGTTSAAAASPTWPASGSVSDNTIVWNKFTGSSSITITNNLLGGAAVYTAQFRSDVNGDGFTYSQKGYTFTGNRFIDATHGTSPYAFYITEPINSFTNYYDNYYSDTTSIPLTNAGPTNIASLASFIPIGGTTSTSNFNGINFSYQAPPLTANSACALQFTYSNNASVSISNTYDAFHKNFLKTAFDIEFWFSFNNMLDGSGYLKNASTASQYFNNNLLKIIKISNGTAEIGYIGYDYDDNTFRFSMNGVGNSDAYIPIRNLNVPFYIVASYKNHKLSIFVNGETGVIGELTNSLLFSSKPSGQFVIDNTSLTSNSGQGFIISDLAFYDYPLSMEQKRKRIVWAYHNEKPTFLTKTLGLSYFDISEKNHHIVHYESLMGNSFSINTVIENLIVDEINGLTPNLIPDVKLNPKSSNPASVIFSSNGAKINNYGSLIVNNLDRLIGNSNPFSLTCQAIRNTSSSVYLFSFLDSTTSNLIYGFYDTLGFSVNYYNFDNLTSSSITYISWPTASTTTYYMGVTFNSSSLISYWSAGGVSAASAIATILPVQVKSGTELEIGNSVSLNSASSDSSIKNFGISNYIDSLIWSNGTGFDYSINRKFLARLTSNLTISQIGYWVKNIPISAYGNSVTSSKIMWDGMDNCLVETSVDRGSTWTKITKGSQIPGISYSNLNNDVYVKVTIPTEYTVQAINQSFNNLDISIYDNMSFLSENNKYELIEKNDATGQFSLNLQRLDQPILFRKDNFGIKFDKNTAGSVQGYAQISPTASTYNFYGIDFWGRFNSIDPGRVNNILVLGSSGPTISIGTTGSLSYTTGNLYVNGTRITSNAFIPIAGQHYHFIYDFGSGYSSSVINIGGSVSGQHMHGCVGYISMWSSSITTSTASSRYLNYVGNYIIPIPSTSTLTTIDASNSTQWQPIWYSDSITTACAFKLG